jgi:hypothetical protein
LNCPITQLQVSFDVCAHIHQLYEYQPFTLYSWQWTHKNPWYNSRYLCYHCMRCWFPCGAITTTCAFFKYVQLLSLTSWHYVHQRWHSHLNRHCCCWPNMSRFISRSLCDPRICCFWCCSIYKVVLLWLTLCWSIPLLSNGGIWMST